MDNVLSIIIVGYDKDSDIWPLSNEMWRDNWPNCPFETIFVSVGKRNSDSPYSKIVTSFGKSAYSERLLAALRENKTDYVLLLLHDFGLHEKPNEDFLLSCCDFMRKNNFKFCQLGTQYKNKIRKSKRIKNTNFSEIKANKMYRINLQPAIWESNFLLEVASSINMESAFDFEALLNQRLGKELSLAKACFPNEYNFPIIDLLEKGKISYLATNFIALNKYTFVTSRPKQSEKEYKKTFFRMKFYEMMPTCLLKLISALRKKESFAKRPVENNDRTIIISGANGFLGSLLVKKFYDNGYRVVSILQEDSNQNIGFISRFSFRIIRTNFNDFSKQIELPKKSIAFIHLAWAGVNGTLKGDEQTQYNNVKMALNAAQMASYSKAQKFIGIGTITELSYLNRISDQLSSSLIYGKYKYACFNELQRFFANRNTKFLWLRLSNLYGLTNKTGNILSYEISSLLKGEEPKFGPCDQYYDFLLADDAIEAIYRFVNLKKVVGETFFVGSGEPNILSKYLMFIDKCLSGGGKIHIGERESDGMVFKKEFFDTKDTVNAIGNYVSDTFENNIVKLIEILKKG